MLTFSGHESNGVTILTAEEASAGDSAASRREWLYTTVSTSEDPRFVIDLSAIHYMASSDIGALLTLKSRIDSRKGKLVLVDVDQFIVDSLRTMRINHLFTIAPDIASAIAVLSA